MVLCLDFPEIRKLDILMIYQMDMKKPELRVVLVGFAGSTLTEHHNRAL